MERPQKATALLLSLLGLFLVAHARSRYEAEDVDISLNVDKQPMEDLLQHMRAILSDNKPQLYVGGHPYLPPKDAAPGSPPCRWINVHLTTGGHRTTLAFADSNIYPVAFKNRTNHWNCFPGYNTLFPDCTVLPFSEDYTSLLGGKNGEGHRKLPTVPLGKDAARRAVQMFSGYDPSTTPEEDAKMATASLVVMISEALRLKPIRQVFTGQHWETKTFVTDKEASLVPLWEQISYCLYLWDKNGAWPPSSETTGLETVGIKNANDALKKVDLLRRPKEIMIDMSIY